MKAISLYQPWASAVAYGHKTIETRSWPTKYRGQLLIHASARRFGWEVELLNAAMFSPVFSRPKQPDEEFFRSGLPRGGIVGCVRLVDCVRTEEVIEAAKRRSFWNPQLDRWWSEADLGNFEPGRWAWILEKPFEIMFLPLAGKQRLFEVDDAELSRAGVML